MGEGEGGEDEDAPPALELPADGGLDEIVRLEVHRRSRLVQHQHLQERGQLGTTCSLLLFSAVLPWQYWPSDDHLGLPEESSGEADQLALAHAQVLPSLRHLVLGGEE